MTLVENRDALGAHVGELRLRRFRLGELAGPDHEEITRHTTDCGPCRARLKSLDDEQRQFEREISFERFAGGVERAGRVPRVHPRRLWTVSAVGFAAAAALLLVVRPGAKVEPGGPGAGETGRHNGIKGSGIGTVQIAAPDGSQRTAAAGSVQALRAGERVRLGYRADAAAHLVAVSVDDAGVVTPLFPERGPGLSVPGGPQVTYLPTSLEFTGKGRERVFLLLAERPLAVEEVEAAARRAHQRARGDLGALAGVPVEGRGKISQFTWLFEKP